MPFASLDNLFNFTSTCYLYLGYNHNFKSNTNLVKYNSKILNIYQNSHWDETFDFVDIILPNFSFFEKRSKIYINCLGLLKRMPVLFLNTNKNILDDVDILYFFIQIFPNFFNITKTSLHTNHCIL